MKLKQQLENMISCKARMNDLFSMLAIEGRGGKELSTLSLAMHGVDQLIAELKILDYEERIKTTSDILSKCQVQMDQYVDEMGKLKDELNG